MTDLILPYALILLGLALMAIEMLLPTQGILFVIGIGGLLVGNTILFSVNATYGIVTLIALFIILPILGPIFLQYWRRSAIGKRMVLEAQDEDDTIANMPVQLELQHLLNRYGKTVSPLRPAGFTEFDGKRVDTLSEGPLIEPGQWVKCVDVRGGRVIVRPTSPPPSLDSFDAGDLRL